MPSVRQKQHSWAILDADVQIYTIIHMSFLHHGHCPEALDKVLVLTCLNQHTQPDQFRPVVLDAGVKRSFQTVRLLNSKTGRLVWDTSWEGPFSQGIRQTWTGYLFLSQLYNSPKWSNNDEGDANPPRLFVPTICSPSVFLWIHCVFGLEICGKALFK